MTTCAHLNFKTESNAVHSTFAAERIAKQNTIASLKKAGRTKRSACIQSTPFVLKTSFSYEATHPTHPCGGTQVPKSPNYQVFARGWNATTKPRKATKTKLIPWIVKAKWPPPQSVTLISFKKLEKS